MQQSNLLFLSLSETIALELMTWVRHVSSDVLSLRWLQVLDAALFARVVRGTGILVRHSTVRMDFTLNRYMIADNSDTL